jgi:HK97 family phage major capsid protein
VQDKILRSVSIGYCVSEWDNPKKREKINGIPVYTAAKWELFEVSIVTIPADAGVGFGRSEEEDVEEVITVATEEVVTEVSSEVVESIPETIEEEEKLAVDTAETTPTISIEDNTMKDNLENVVSAPVITLSAKEEREYSISKAVLSMADGKRNGLAFEVSDEIAKSTGKDPAGFFMPTSTRTAFTNITDAAGGANLVYTQQGAFIDYLRNKSTAVKAGTQVISLTAKTALPRQDNDITAAWVSEEGGTTMTSMSLAQVTFSPKKLISLAGYTREALVLSTPSIEMIVRNSIYGSMGVALDKAIFDGAGTSEPTGILRTTGLASSSFVASGSVINFGACVNLWSKVATANADNGALAYVTTPGLLGYMRSNPKFTYSSTGIAEADTCNGYPIFASNHIPTSQSNGHTLLFGDFNNAVIAEFGAIDLVVDPYTSKAKGIIELSANLLADVQIKHILGFCVIKSMLVA